MPFLSDYVRDNGLTKLDEGALAFHICSAEPAGFAGLAAVSLGSKAAPVVSAPADGSPNGRQSVISIFTDGLVTVDGITRAWALTDQAAPRVLASSTVLLPKPVTAGSIFSLVENIIIRTPDAA